MSCSTLPTNNLNRPVTMSQYVHDESAPFPYDERTGTAAAIAANETSVLGSIYEDEDVLALPFDLPWRPGRKRVSTFGTGTIHRRDDLGPAACPFPFGLALPPFGFRSRPTSRLPAGARFSPWRPT
jgi:hypothetical protein